MAQRDEKEGGGCHFERTGLFLDEAGARTGDPFCTRIVFARGAARNKCREHKILRIRITVRPSLLRLTPAAQTNSCWNNEVREREKNGRRRTATATVLYIYIYRHVFGRRDAHQGAKGEGGRGGYTFVIYPYNSQHFRLYSRPSR